ncbi:MAG TPA: hypothetical protein VHL52_04735 [Acidimicrobiia bacterium]|nr:hypothetical protein [Acidimicrobiia bacterium]
MGKRIRSRWALLGAVAAAAVLGLATFPASGEHVPEEVDQLHLHLGTDGNYFRHVPVQGDALPDQPITVGANCIVSTNGSLASLQGRAGYHNQSLGIKTGGSQGVPCSRIDSNEQLGITLVGVQPATAADFDLELKGDVHLQIIASLGGSQVGTFNVRSGSFVAPGSTDDTTAPFTVVADPDADCRGASDSGPDSGINDNCRVTIDPGVPFDKVTFKPISGEVSLEGSGDFGNSSAQNTIFYLQTEQWDGELACDDPAVSTESGGVEASITRHTNLTDPTGADCEPKLYRLNADSEAETITFELSDPEDQQAFYEGTLTLPGELTTPTAELTLEISTVAPFNVFEDVLACDEAPFDGNGDPNGGAFVDAPPSGFSADACVVDVKQTWDDKTIWHVVFRADPRFR